MLSVADEPRLDEPRTIVELLRARAIREPEALSYVFLRDGEEEEARLTARTLDAAARSVAAFLQQESSEGDRVLLAFRSGLAFITTFLGCLYAGAVPVPVSLPRNPRNLARFRAVAADCGARLGLADPETAARLLRRENDPHSGGLRWLALDDSALGSPDAWRPFAPEPNALAFLQYTSGSTGEPKGVMISHQNLMANEHTICRAFEHSQKTVFVGWLPLFHDMGLIGNVFQPLYLGIPSVLMSPVAFLQKPYRWLKAISDYRATTSGAPNFAYDLCVQKITEAQRATLDLSSWDLAFNGAEPVRAKTLTSFSDTFASCGFRRETFYPCYGMAETTLFATGGPKGRPRVLHVDAGELERQVIRRVPPGSSGARAIVSCGKAWEEVAVVDMVTRRQCASGSVGEVWLRGPSVGTGYYGRAQLSSEIFAARRTDADEGGYLRTGDLGFLDDGELFVTGRHKELIIIRGRNHHPHDIESTVETSHPALEPAGGAAFSIEADGEERLVVVQEVALSHRARLDTPEVIAAIQRAITVHHDLHAHAIVLLKPKSLPKTSSGKIQRGICRSRFLEGTLERFADGSLRNRTPDRPGIRP